MLIVEHGVGSIKSKYEDIDMNIPKLKRKEEYLWHYNRYSLQERINTVISYLFEGKSQAKIDGEILLHHNGNSKGFRSMGILHYLGIKRNFKGVFKGLKLEEAIAKLNALNDPDYDTIIALINSETIILNDIDLETREVHSVEEGGRITYYTTRYERSPQNRKKAIELHGAKCEVCGFDFEKTYGELGKDYIEVHHLTPLSETNAKITPDLKTEMTVLCSNCHRMIHRKGILKPEELKKLLNKQNL